MKLNLNGMSKKVAICVAGGVAASALAITLIVSTKGNNQITIDNSDISYSAIDVSSVQLINDAMQSSEAPVSKEALEVNVVSTQIDTTSPYDGRFVVNVDDSLNIRDTASEDGEIVGHIYAGSDGDIIEEDGIWTKISSGNVIGYVKTEYIVTGEAAETLAAEVGKKVGTVNCDSLRVRKDSSESGELLEVLAIDTKVNVIGNEDGWYEVCLKSGISGFVKAEYVNIEIEMKQAYTVEEEIAAYNAEQEQLRAEQAAYAASVSNNTVSYETETVEQAPIAASYDDAYLLACLVSMEAGYESYETQLAVANVVLNRLSSGIYGGSISDVIYARGQFPCVNGSVMNGYLANGPLSGSQDAANAALGGSNNIGSCMYFSAASTSGSYDNSIVLGNICFH